MKKLLAVLLSIMLCVAMLFTTACEPVTDTGSSPGSSDTAGDNTGDTTGDNTGSTGEPEDVITVTGVSLPASIRSFISKSGVQTNKETEFFVNSETEGAEVIYKVGDDNAFKFRPEVSYMNEDYEDVDAPADESFTAAVTTVENGAAVDASAYYTYDSINSTFDFNETAIGKTFTIKVRPNGLDAEQENNAKYSVSLDVKVIDGYNAYEEAELGYITNIDVINDKNGDGINDSIGTAHRQYGWKAFREANGLTLNPQDIKAVILHDDMYITKDVVPSSYFYNEANVPTEHASKKDYIIGSLRDDRFSGLYTRRLANGETFDIVGNYYTIDTQKFPHVIIMDEPTNIVFDAEGNITDSNVQSHSAVFFIDGTGRGAGGTPDAKANMCDIYSVGNSPKEDNLLYSGGLILLKTERMNMNVNNIISRCYFITTMKCVFNDCTIKNMKCYDSFNAPIYNWAGYLYVDNCIIKGAGGPAVIVDAAKDTGVYIKPITVVSNTVLDNPITGKESWFIMANATALIPQIMGLDAVSQGIYGGLKANEADLNANGISVPALKSFITTKKVNEQNVSFMNIYCVVKNDGDSLGNDISAYIEINGNVLDYGAGLGKEGEATNAPAGTTPAAYRTALRQYVLGACRTYGAPVLESAGGGIVYFNGTSISPMPNPDGITTDPAKYQQYLADTMNLINFLNGDALNIYYHNSLFGTLGIMFEYKTVA